MSAGPFGPRYAAAYDLLYADKDYAAECDLVERVARTYAPGPVRRILDLGCGTGGHALLLASRGYDVTGVDASGSMLELARRKDPAACVRFLEGDIRTLDLEEQFDLVTMLFAVVGYLTEESDIESALLGARRHLRLGGVLVFDFWYGPAVRSQRPGKRTVRADGLGQDELTRRSEGTLDEARRLCTVDFRLTGKIGGEAVDFREIHEMRYFDEDEIVRYLEGAAFELRLIGAFPDFHQKPDEGTWSAVAVAQAV